MHVDNRILVYIRSQQRLCSEVRVKGAAEGGVGASPGTVTGRLPEQRELRGTVRRPWVRVAQPSVVQRAQTTRNDVSAVRRAY